MKMRLPLIFAVTVCACVLAASPAMAFTEFVQKKGDAGSQHKGGKQIFKTNIGTVECELERGTGSSEKEKSSEYYAEAVYENCLGSTKELKGIKTAVSPGQYILHANGTLSIQNKITIKAEVLGLKCEVEVNGGAAEEGKNSELSGLTYANVGSGVTVKAGLKENISYDVLKSGGGFCGTAGVAKNGSYEGEIKTERYASLICVYYPLGQYKDNRCTMAVLDGQFKRQGSYETLEVK